MVSFARRSARRLKSASAGAIADYMLQRDGHMDNHKRIYRVYCEEGLQVRKRKRKRARTKRSFDLLPSEQPNQRWSMDFMHDSTEGGRKIRLLNIVDDYTREALWMEVSTSIT